MSDHSDDGLIRQEHSSTRQAASKVLNSLEEQGGETFLDAGLNYIKRGWRIFGVNARKEPLKDLFPHGFKDATTDEAKIRACAAKYPGASWALAVEGDLLVGDLDVKHGDNGIRDFERLHRCHPKDFEAPRVRTATGGYHLYLDRAGREFQNTVGKIAPGIDTRAAGLGYVVLPSGANGYRWETSPDTPRPPAPEWMEAAMRQECKELVAEAKSFQGQTPFGLEVLRRSIDRIINAPNKQQEFTLSLEALKLGHYVAGGVLDYQPTLEAAISAGMQMHNYDESHKWSRQEVTRKVVRRIQRGMEDPWDDGTAIDEAMAEVNRRYTEDPQLHDSVLELLRELASKPELPTSEQKGEPQPAGELKDEPQPAISEQKGEPGAAAGEQASPDKAEHPAAAQESNKAGEPAAPWLKPGEPLLIRRMGLGAPPPVPFLVDGLFHEVGTGLMAAKFYGGKTFVGMSLAASIATGSAFAGREVRRPGAVLWLAAEGEREVDKRIRAAVRALGCEPDAQPIYVQIASVPKISGGEQLLMNVIRQAARAAKAEFGVPLALVVIDTMIKAAGYKKSESDSVEVNNVIQVMENISVRAKCFVLAIDHMGKNEDLGARGSSDKPSSVDVYLEIKPTAGKARLLHAVKIKGEPGDDQIEFEVLSAMQDNGQSTGFVRWKKWVKSEEAGKSLNKNAQVLLACARDVIARDGKMRVLLHSEPPTRCVEKVAISHEFSKRYEGGRRHDVAFNRSWQELVKAGLITTVKQAGGFDDMNDWAYLESV